MERWEREVNNPETDFGQEEAVLCAGLHLLSITSIDVVKTHPRTAHYQDSEGVNRQDHVISELRSGSQPKTETTGQYCQCALLLLHSLKLGAVTD